MLTICTQQLRAELIIIASRTELLFAINHGKTDTLVQMLQLLADMCAFSLVPTRLRILDVTQVFFKKQFAFTLRHYLFK